MNFGTSFQNVADIAVVSLLIFFILRWVLNNSRALQILKGAVIIILLKIAADLLHLTTTSALFQSVLIWGPLIFIILLQPEIRFGLETLADTKRYVGIRSSSDSPVRIIAEVAFEFAKEREGALFVFENTSSLKSFEESGVKLDAVVSKTLVRNIFDKSSNMHDGAMLIRGSRIAATSVILPLSQNFDLSQHYGTRHRSALGLSEETDAIIVIVSEERGEVSVAANGQISVVSNVVSLRSKLTDLLGESEGVSNEAVL